MLDRTLIGRRIAGILCIFMLSSCGSNPSFNPRTSRDEFTGNERVEVECVNNNNFAITYELFTSQTPHSSIKVVKLPLLHVVYFGHEWIFIRQRESLEVLIDGTRVTFSPMGSVQRNTLGEGVTESAAYALTPDELKMIVSGTQVKLRVSGDEASEVFNLSSAAILNGRRFYETYVQPDPIPNDVVKQLRE